MASKIAEIDPEVRLYLSRVIDTAVLEVYNEAIKLIQKTSEHKNNYKVLSKAPKNCGGFKPRKKAILEEANAFEQMVQLDHVNNTHAADWPVESRTYAFHHSDTEVIHLYVSS